MNLPRPIRALPVQSLGRFLLVLAMVLSSGGHWVVIQSVAWGQMLMRYSEEGSVASAIVKTFDGKHPCEICKVVQEGQEQESESAVSPAKFVGVYLLPASPLALYPPRPTVVLGDTPEWAEKGSYPPSVPPPRRA